MNRQTKARIVAFAVVGMALTVLPVRGSAQAQRPPRTFPEFVGTWVLDEAASTGRLTMAPPPPRRVTIAITPVDITLTKVLRVTEEVRNSPYWTGTETPPPEIYRFDGSEMIAEDSRSERRHSFRLVADALAFTTKETRPNSGGLFNIITDAYSVTPGASNPRTPVDGTQLTMQRQLTLVAPPGHLVSMPSNDSRHVFIYRRAPAGNVR